MFVHTCEFSVGKFPGGEEFDQTDIEMRHGIHDIEFFGGEADAGEARLPGKERRDRRSSPDWW